MSSVKPRTTEYLNIDECSFPLPFPQQLEFSSPARGTWNIVHTGMLIPESHQIFVCAKGCLRGVVLTAAEMGAMGRYSALEITEDNVLNGDMEEMMITGVTDIINKLPVRPRSILIFISCQHFFLAYDQKLVFRKLSEMFPDIEFIDCYMIPTLRKSGITPDQKMRIQMYGMLKPRTTDPARINLMGSNRPLSDSSELDSYLEEKGYNLTSIHQCRTFDEYLALAEGSLNIIYEPMALRGAEDMEKRLGIPYLYLPSFTRPEDIRSNYRRLADRLGINQPDFGEMENEINRQAAKTLALTGDAPVTIDYTFSFRPLNLARFLAEQGFNVTDIYIDAFLPEEEMDFNWLKENRKGIRIHPTSRPSMRFYTEKRPEALALGQKAAEFTGTDRFVNVAEGGGFWGMGSVTYMLQLMEDAYMNPKDRRDVIQKKGTQMRSVLNEEGYRPADECRPGNGAGFSSQCYSEQHVASLVPTYSSDEFGVCSLLYELGGMVVMHDASGCNSTYTTHDEPRWYDHESMIYISAISEMEAIMGDDEKLITDVTEAARELKPDFTAVIGAPIPYMIGTDFRAIAEILEDKLDIPCWGLAANGMQGYGAGISMAIESLIRRFTKEPEAVEKNKTEEDGGIVNVNLLGATPLDYCINGSCQDIGRWIEKQGMKVNANLGMTGTLDDYRRAALADVNLVLSYGGLGAARLMKRKYGIPYVIGAPLGEDNTVLAESLRAKASSEQVATVPSGPAVAVIGEGVASVALAQAIEREYGCRSVAVASTDCDKEILRDWDVEAPCEADVVKALRAIKPAAVVADPFYQVLCRKEIIGCEPGFCRRPHEAFSGRIFDMENQNLVDRPLEEGLGLGRILKELQ